MKAPTPLVGRDDEIAAGARAAFAASTGRPVLVLVEGEPGVGMTALLREIARDAVDDSDAIVPWMRPDHASLSQAHAAVRAQPVNRRVVLLLDDAGNAEADCAALFVRLLDQESSRPLLVLVGARPPRRAFARAAVDLLAGGMPGTRLWLRGLTVEAAAALPGASHDPELLSATGGNPAWLRACWRGVASAAEPGTDLARDARSLLKAMDVGERAVVDVLACSAGALPTAVIDKALKQQFSIRAIRRNLGPLLEDGGLGLRLDSALIRHAALRTLKLEEQREIHRVLAAATGGTERAHHLLAALGPEGDEALSAELERDATAFLADDNWHEAALAFARAARAHPDTDERERLLLDAGCVIGLAEDFDLARMFGSEVAALRRTPMRDVLLAGLQYFAGHFEPALAALAALLSATGEGELRGRARVLALIIVSSAKAIVGETSAALVAGRAAAATDVADNDPVRPLLHRVMWMQIASVEWANGHIVDALSITDRLLDEDSGKLEHTDTLLLRGAIHFYGGRSLAAHDDLKRGDALADANVATLRRRMSEHTVIDFHLGNWTQAQQRGLQTITAGRHNGDIRGVAAAEAVVAMIAHARGDTVLADTLLTSAKAFAHRPSPFAVLHVATADAWIARERGDALATLTALAPIRETPVAEWSERIGLFAWQALSVGALIGTGQLDQAQDECIRLTALVSRRPAAPLVHGHPEWLAGRLAAARGDTGRARTHFRSARRLSVGMPYPAALVALSAASLERSAGRDDDANLLLGEALAIFHRLEASATAAHISAELQRERSFGVLSPRERHVARLVARGYTNEKVGEELAITVKTVEFHLAHILKKLGHSSRRELWSSRASIPGIS